MAPSILTVGGSYFHFDDPEHSRIDINDIAHALSNLCRYTGHCRRFYSVAQHSVLVSHVVPPEHALAGLLHDAAEAFLGDVASPLKALLPEYKAIEKRVERAVLATFGIHAMPSCVKHADLVLLATEKRDLMPARGHDWPIVREIEPLTATIVPLPPGPARMMFLARYQELFNA